MNEVKIYTTPWCPYCIRAKHMLTKKGVEFQDIDVSRQPALRQEMELMSGRQTVPQIWIGTFHVGGCDELLALDRTGKLDTMLVAVD